MTFLLSLGKVEKVNWKDQFSCLSSYFQSTITCPICYAVDQFDAKCIYWSFLFLSQLLLSFYLTVWRFPFHLICSLDGKSAHRKGKHKRNVGIQPYVVCGTAGVAQSVQRLVTGWTIGVRFPTEVGNFSVLRRVHIGSRAHQASCTMGPLPEDKAAGSWSWPLSSL
jgi:hypothetical protein